MDSDKNQTHLGQTTSEQTGSKPHDDKPDTGNQADGKHNDHQIPGNYSGVISVAKLGLKNWRSRAELQRRRDTISMELEQTRELLAEARGRLETIPEFDEDDLAEYRQILEARARDSEAKSALSEAEEDEDQEDEDIIYDDCHDGDSGDEDSGDEDSGDDESGDEDNEGVLLGSEVLSESLHDDSCSSADGIEAGEETNSNLNANWDEGSDSDAEVDLNKGKGVKIDPSLNEECF